MVQPMPPASEPLLAQCEYCGRFGVLGQCEGCGAPNAPAVRKPEMFLVSSTIDCTHLRSPGEARAYVRGASRLEWR
jgi:hypothetical protein